MGVKDHRQRKARGPKKAPTNRDVLINGVIVQKVGHVDAPDVYSYPSLAMGSYFWQSPLVQGDHQTPNSHTYIKQVRVSPTATLGLKRNDIPFINERSGPLEQSLDFYSVLFKNTDNPWADGIFENTQKRASHKFFDSLQESSANLAVDFAEASQSRDMIAKRCAQLSKIFRNLKKLAYRWWKNLLWNRANPKLPPRWVPPKFREAQSPLDIVSNTWLEWKLGWSPLLSSIFGVLDHTKNLARRFRVRANTKGLKRLKFTPAMTIPGRYVAWTDVEASVYCTWCADYENTSPVLHDKNRLTSFNPASVIWELVPFSFVFDYFINIGRWLSEVEASFHAGLTFIRGYDVTVARYLNKISVPQLALTVGNADYYQDGGKGREYSVYKQRNRWYSTPMPFPPGWEPKIGAQRILTLAALINQLFFSKGAFR
jgi:hypothetical protein